MAPRATDTVIRSYRVHFRDCNNAIVRSYDIDLGSDEEARQLATLMLDEQGIYHSAEVRDRGRLVSTVHRGHE
jgi:hypothetical protein